MITVDVVQGSKEWLELRAKYDTASEAPAMMGVSPYMSRSDLIRQKKTGDVEEVDAHKQALFDRGHAAEASARVIVEEAIGEELFPITGVNEQNGLLASFDGLTMGGKTGYEHKLWNESVAAQVRSGNLGPEYYWQLEQQLLLSGAEKIIFVCSDGTPEKFLSMEYRAGNGRAEQLRAGWKQFREDLAVYVPPVAAPALVAAAQETLPSVFVKIEGTLAVIDNLDAFATKLTAYIGNINKSPKTDQDFLDLKAVVANLAKAGAELDAGEKTALASIASVNTMQSTVGTLRALIATNRILCDKIYKAENDRRKLEIIQGGRDTFGSHIDGLNNRLGKPYMPVIAADFTGVAKNLRTLVSLQNAVDTELARAKIDANAEADKIDVNLKTLVELGSDHKFLFADAAQIVLKANDDLIALVKLRIADHKVAEDKRLEAERAKIRAEEEAKAKAEQERKTREQADADRKAQEAQQAAVATPAQPAALHPMPQAPSTGYSAVLSSPAPKPKVVATASGPRPTDADIIKVVANHYRVSEEKVIFWISQMSAAQNVA